MTKADTIFKENITKIMEEGVWSEQARPKYKDGTTANSKYITGSFAEYDLSKGEFPITTLRPIAIKSAIKEVLWIYQDQSNSLDVLEDKYNVHYWNDWEVEGVPANNGDIPAPFRGAYSSDTAFSQTEYVPSGFLHSARYGPRRKNPRNSGRCCQGALPEKTRRRSP